MSEDNSSEIVKKLTGSDPRFHFIKNAEKRWKNFLTDNSDLIESAQPKPLKIYINEKTFR